MANPLPFTPRTPLQPLNLTLDNSPLELAYTITEVNDYSFSTVHEISMKLQQTWTPEQRRRIEILREQLHEARRQRNAELPPDPPDNVLMTSDERTSGCLIIDPGASSGFSSIAAAEQIQVQRVCANEPGLPQIVHSDKSFKLADGNNAGTGSKVLQPITAGLLKGQTVELNLADVSSSGTAPL